MDDNEMHDVDEETRLKEIGHPRGTLAIVLLYAGLFAFGWIWLYVGAFLGRGAPH